jgi:uncharacterized protein
MTRHTTEAELGAARVVRSLYDAVEAGDHTAIRSCLDEDVRWRQAAAAVPAAGEELVGAEALLEGVIRPFERDWEGFTEELDELVASGDLVVATGTYRGTYRPTGRSLVAEFCHVWRVTDGRIAGFRQFTDTAAFAAATGDDLRPGVEPTGRASP